MVQAQTEELPIDIDYAKFLPWLIDRRRIPRDWHTYLKSARSLLRQAIKSTPPSARSSLNLTLSDPLAPSLPYFQTLDILTALTASDVPPEWQAGPEKDLLGRYKHPTSRAWADVVAAFENKYVYLADCAQVLTRNADVEAAALRDSISRLQREAAELIMKDAPTVRAAAEARERFELACEEFELPREGDVDYYQLLEKAVDQRVPVLLREAVSCVKRECFGDAMAYFDVFAGYVPGGDAARDLCPTVRKVMEADIDELVRPISRDDDSGMVADCVDSGTQVATDIAGPDAAHAVIDWGIEIDDARVADAAPDAEQEDPGGTEQATGDGGTDWGESIETLDGNGKGGQEGAGDANSEVLTLADPAVREMFLNDLIELDAFLAQRDSELNRLGDTDVGLIMQQATGTPDLVKAIDTQKVGMMQEVVEMAISAINSADTRRILTLQSDSNRLERAARAILKKKEVAERTHVVIEVLRKRRSKAQEELSMEVPKLAQLGLFTRDIKRRTEVALSALYKGRTVNILGEINNIFPPVE